MQDRKQISVYCDASDITYLDSLGVGSTKFFRFALDAYKRGEWKLPPPEKVEGKNDS